MYQRIVFLSLSVVLALTLGGCAHPISMAPNLATVQPAADKPMLDKKAGYHISAASKALEVTTPGGGGDKVRYFPYRDLEPGLYKALGVVFRDVAKINNPTDAAELSASGIQLLITPEITTNSSSESALTWPPTVFTVTLSCQIKDMQGKTLDSLRVEGRGQAEFSEFKSNFSLAAVRASDDALAKLIVALRQSTALAK
ncbi:MULTISPECIES: hypothetical protein [unclassified Acidovorax]|uniref:hypothetical protein n=1 Tax=unclassified Acidovorax TaxID=2684926 RepID=UPI0006F3C48E|nr:MULTISPECIES: hypothetical protein [unclassified Acidovorax]KRB30392.1 hypothetical protein ASD94_04185 [Acidovorax sp. Root70]PUA98306.1 hypothetical protein C8C99_3174 [Acidovorax sp. 107]